MQSDLVIFTTLFAVLIKFSSIFYLPKIVSFFPPKRSICAAQIFLDVWFFPGVWLTYQGRQFWRKMTLPLPVANIANSSSNRVEFHALSLSPCWILV